MHELTAGKVAVAGLDPDGVAAEEAAEGGSAVTLQPCPQQLHPLLRCSKEAVSKEAVRKTCSLPREMSDTHIAHSGPIRVELLDDLLDVARGRHGRQQFGNWS